MPIVKGLVAQGRKMHWRLARIVKVSPKTYWVRELQINPSGEIVELWQCRWWRDRCVPVSEDMLKLLKELARLNDIYRRRHKELDAEHQEYGQPIVRALEAEVERVRASSEPVQTAEDSGITTPDVPSSG